MSTIPRIIPILLIANGRLVKTKRFRAPLYVGDPTNTVRIFSELRADEVVILDISASRYGKNPDFRLLADIAAESTIPSVYGGGIRIIEQAKRIFDLGFEKISLNTHALRSPSLLQEISSLFGRQALVVSMDFRKGVKGDFRLLGEKNSHVGPKTPAGWAKFFEASGAGELLITSVRKEGVRGGMDGELVSELANAVDIPVIANGGFGEMCDADDVLRAGASAVGVGTAFVFQRKRTGILVSYSRLPGLATLKSTA